MRTSCTIAIALLVFGTLFGWQGSQRLDALQKERRLLVTKARSLGLPTETNSKPILSPRASDRQLSERERATMVQLIATDLSLLIRNMEHAEDVDDRDLSPEIRQRMIDIMDRLLQLNRAELEIFCREIAENPDIETNLQRSLVSSSIAIMATDYPKLALERFIDYSEMLDFHHWGDDDIKSVLVHWAARDPMAVLEWSKQPSSVTSGTISPRSTTSNGDRSARNP